MKIIIASTSKIEILRCPAETTAKAGHFSLRTPLTSKQLKMAKLVGKGASLGGVVTTVPWDTGSQVSVVGTNWKTKCQTLK